MNEHEKSNHKRRVDFSVRRTVCCLARFAVIFARLCLMLRHKHLRHHESPFGGKRVKGICSVKAKSEHILTREHSHLSDLFQQENNEDNPFLPQQRFTFDKNLGSCVQHSELQHSHYGYLKLQLNCSPLISFWFTQRFFVGPFQNRVSYGAVNMKLERAILLALILAIILLAATQSGTATKKHKSRKIGSKKYNSKWTCNYIPAIKISIKSPLLQTLSCSLMETVIKTLCKD